MNHLLTVIIQREKDGSVALCPELDIASQGNSFEDAGDSLREAVGLFFECAPCNEIERRLQTRGRPEDL